MGAIMAEHTPLPWRVEQETDLIWGACNTDDFSTRGMGYSIVEGKSGSWNKGKPDMDEREANAAFIVKAVNAHDALIEALRPFAWYFDLNDCEGRRDDDALEVPMRDLRVAFELFKTLGIAVTSDTRRCGKSASGVGVTDLLTPSEKPVSAAVTTGSIMVALRNRFAAPEYSFFEEVGDSGSSSRVYADGVAINMWASRGYAITGFEVKASRSDWLRELKQPDKAEPVITKCDYWYLVAPDEVYKADEVPVSWGILSYKDGQLREKRKPPKLEPKPITRAFVAQMFRRSNDKEEKDISGRVAKALASDRADMERRIDARVEQETRQLRDDGEKWKAFLAQVGEREWASSEPVIQAVKVVLKSGVTGSYSGIAELLQKMKWATEQLERASAMFKDDPETPPAVPQANRP